MSDGPQFNTFALYASHEALNDSWKLPKEPFTRSRIHVPLLDMVDAIDLIYTHAIHEREKTDIDDEDMAAIRRLKGKLKKVQEFDLDQRKRQDRILRCLHPDGCFFGSLPDNVIRKAYEMAEKDPIKGVPGLNLGWDPELVVRLSNYLDEEVEKVKRKRQTY